MHATRKDWRSAAALLVALMAPALALGQPECDGARHGRRDCPRTEYSPLHYWTPALYQVRACIRPSNLDQYPPGVPTPVMIDMTKSRCRTLPPMATSPYADPAAYFGRPVVPQK